MQNLRVISSIPEMQALADQVRREGKRIGLVPTMGYLHEGHLSLLRAARKVSDLLVMSLFVNPTQFGPHEDYQTYPRDFERDRVLAASEGTDIIFAPAAGDMYPKGYTTWVEVAGLSDKLCGQFRPGHFRGVATIVTKLFNIVKPHVAFFGQKDAQQSIIIQRMVQDLNMDIQIEVLPTVREPDGLALSSRNVYLSQQEHQAALVLSRSLDLAQKLIQNGERSTAVILSKMRELIAQEPLVTLEYVAITDLSTLEDLKEISSRTLIALAAKVGKTRLIDNCIVTL
jgi:pantoate--beta-alanine ligase